MAHSRMMHTPEPTVHLDYYIRCKLSYGNTSCQSIVNQQWDVPPLFFENLPFEKLPVPFVDSML
jgi:hypothetical protein